MSEPELGGKKATGTSEGARYHCDYCHTDITSKVRIKCAECTDFDLCLECFAYGVELFPHKACHAYRVMDHVTTPIFEEHWGADEELLLLEAIEMFGLGNWQEVSCHVGRKTKAECEQHYLDVYLTSSTAPLPDLKLSLPRAAGVPSLQEERARQRKEDKKKDSTKVESMADRIPKPNLGHLVGYLPLRADFETEYENDAEVILADMEFKDEDTHWERELKLKVLEIYNSKLDQRMERKKFVLERGLLNKKVVEAEKKRSKEEREIYSNMRVFARFHSPVEHEAFVQGLINEQRIRARIMELQQARQHGIRSLSEVATYKLEKRKRDQSADSAKRKKLLKKSDVVQFEPSRRQKTELSLVGSEGKATWSWTKDEVEKLEGCELLSEQEKLLCATLKMFPRHYYVVKERLLRESYARGFLDPGVARQLIKLDIFKTEKILDFFVSVGWSSPPPSENPHLNVGVC